MDFENELNAFKEKTRAMCDAMDCRELLNDYLVEIEVCRPTYYHFYEAGQQSKQAEIDALQQQNQRLAMRLDVIQGVLQKQIDLIVELKNDT